VAVASGWVGPALTTIGPDVTVALELPARSLPFSEKVYVPSATFVYVCGDAQGAKSAGAGAAVVSAH